PAGSPVKHGLSDVGQQAGRALDAEAAAVQHQVVVGKDVLHLGAVAPVVELPGAVHLPDHPAGGGLVHAQLLGAVLQPPAVGGVDIHPQAVGQVGQDAAPAAAHHNAGTSGRQVPDDVFLDQEDLVPDAGHAHAQGIEPAEIHGLGRFFGVADHRHRQAHAAGGLFHDVPVVKVDVQLP